MLGLLNPRRSPAGLLAFLAAILISLPAGAAKLLPDKNEIAVGETVFVRLDADLVLMAEWSASPELEILNSSGKGATVKGVKAGKAMLTVKYLGGKKSVRLSVTGAVTARQETAPSGVMPPVPAPPLGAGQAAGGVAPPAFTPGRPTLYSVAPSQPAGSYDDFASALLAKVQAGGTATDRELLTLMTQPGEVAALTGQWRAAGAGAAIDRALQLRRAIVQRVIDRIGADAGDDLMAVIALGSWAEAINPGDMDVLMRANPQAAVRFNKMVGEEINRIFGQEGDDLVRQFLSEGRTFTVEAFEIFVSTFEDFGNLQFIALRDQAEKLAKAGQVDEAIRLIHSQAEEIITKNLRAQSWTAAHGEYYPGVAGQDFIRKYFNTPGKSRTWFKSPAGPLTEASGGLTAGQIAPEVLRKMGLAVDQVTPFSYQFPVIADEYTLWLRRGRLGAREQAKGLARAYDSLPGWEVFQRLSQQEQDALRCARILQNVDRENQWLIDFWLRRFGFNDQAGFARVGEEALWKLLKHSNDKSLTIIENQVSSSLKKAAEARAGNAVARMEAELLRIKDYLASHEQLAALSKLDQMSLFNLGQSLPDNLSFREEWKALYELMAEGIERSADDAFLMARRLVQLAVSQGRLSRDAGLSTIQALRRGQAMTPEVEQIVAVIRRELTELAAIRSMTPAVESLASCQGILRQWSNNPNSLNLTDEVAELVGELARMGDVALLRLGFKDSEIGLLRQLHQARLAGLNPGRIGERLKASSPTHWKASLRMMVAIGGAISIYSTIRTLSDPSIPEDRIEQTIGESVYSVFPTIGLLLEGGLASDAMLSGYEVDGKALATSFALSLLEIAGLTGPIGATAAGVALISYGTYAGLTYINETEDDRRFVSALYSAVADKDTLAAVKVAGGETRSFETRGLAVVPNVGAKSLDIIHTPAFVDMYTPRGDVLLDAGPYRKFDTPLRTALRNYAKRNVWAGNKDLATWETAVRRYFPRIDLDQVESWNVGEVSEQAASVSGKPFKVGAHLVRRYVNVRNMLTEGTLAQLKARVADMVSVIRNTDEWREQLAAIETALTMEKRIVPNAQAEVESFFEWLKTAAMSNATRIEQVGAIWKRYLKTYGDAKTQYERWQKIHEDAGLSIPPANELFGLTGAEADDKPRIDKVYEAFQTAFGKAAGEFKGAKGAPYDSGDAFDRDAWNRLLNIRLRLFLAEFFATTEARKAALEKDVLAVLDEVRAHYAGRIAGVEITGPAEMKLHETAGFDARFARSEDWDRPGLVLRWSVNGVAGGEGRRLGFKAEQAGMADIALAVLIRDKSGEKKAADASLRVKVVDPADKQAGADPNLAREIEAALKARDWKRLADLLDQVRKDQDRRIKETEAWQADVDALLGALETLKKERMAWALAWKEYMEALSSIDSRTWQKLTDAVDKQRELVVERCHKNARRGEDGNVIAARCAKEGTRYYEGCLGDQPNQHYEETKRIRMAMQELPDKVLTLHSAGYFTHRDWFVAVEKITEQYKLPFPYPKVVTPRLKYSSGCASVTPPAGEKGPGEGGEIQVTLRASREIVKLGETAVLTATASGGKAPYAYAWSGVAGSGSQATLKPLWAGEWTARVAVTDSDGKTGEGSVSVQVAPANATLAGAKGQVFYGSEARLTATGIPDLPAPKEIPAEGTAAPGGKDYSAECTPGASCRWLCSRRFCQCTCPPAEWKPGPNHCAPGDNTLLCQEHGKFCGTCPDKPTQTPTTGSTGDKPAEAGKFRVVWQSTPGLTFEPSTSEDGGTTVRYDRMGEATLWCEIHRLEEGAYHTVGRCDEAVVTVVAPKFTVGFNPPQGKARVGEEVRARIASEPEVADKLIDFRWLDPASGNRMEYGDNAREIGFKVKDTRPMPLNVLARVPFHGDEIAEIADSYTGTAYEVSIGAPRLREPQFPIWVCDTQLGGAAKCGMRDIPQGQFVTHQDIFLAAVVTPAPDSPRYQWSVSPSGVCGLPGIGNELRINCSETGTYTVSLEVKDADGRTLGTASTTVSVSVEMSKVTTGAKKAEAAKRVDQAKQLWGQGKHDEAVAAAEAAAQLDKDLAAPVLGQFSQGLKQQGWDALNKGDRETAIKRLEQAVRLNPNDADAKKKLADARDHVARWPQVEAKVREFDDHVANKRIWSAQKTMLSMQDILRTMAAGQSSSNPTWKRVMDDFNTGLADYNRFSQEKSAKHTQYFKDENYPEMLRNAESMRERELSPADEKECQSRIDFARRFLGAAELARQASELTRQGQYDQALAAINKAREIHPKSAATAAQELADVAKREGKAAESKRDFQSSGHLFDIARQAMPQDNEAHIGANNAPVFQKRVDEVRVWQREVEKLIANGDWDKSESRLEDIKRWEATIPGEMFPETRSLLERQEAGYAAYKAWVEPLKQEVGRYMQHSCLDKARAKIMEMRGRHLIWMDQDWTRVFLEAIDDGKRTCSTGNVPLKNNCGSLCELDGDVVGSDARGTYLGCYRDEGTRDLADHTFNTGNMTSALCIAECAKRGFAYAATQYASHCFCGNRYGRYGPATNCDNPCSGNGAEKCGGSWANSVYATGVGGSEVRPPDKPCTPYSEPLVTGTYNGPGIRVRTGNYGHNCGACFGNATEHLARACDGKSRCEYRIDRQAIGDPKPGCDKDYVAVWKCPDDETWYAANASPEAGFGSVVVLQCPGNRGAALPPDSPYKGTSQVVGISGYGLTSDLVEPNGTVTLRWTAPAEAPDNTWVGLIPSGVGHGSTAQNDQHDMAYQYIGKARSGSMNFTAPAKEGSYDLRLSNPASGKELASVTFRVQVNKAAASLSLPKSVYAPNEKVVVRFTASAGYPKNAWVGLIPSGVGHGSTAQNDQHDMAYKYLEGRTAGELEFTAPNKAGSYDLRMNETTNDREVASVTFTVGVPTEGAGLSLAKTRYAPNEPIKLRFTAPATFPKNAWVGLIPSGVGHGSTAQNDQHDMAYKYLDGRTAGDMEFTAPSKVGSYDLRMNETTNDKEVASVTFAVAVPVEGAQLWLAKAAFKPGEEIRLRFQASPLLPRNAWVGLIPSGIGHGSTAQNDQHDAAYKYLDGKASGELVFTAPNGEGSWDFRLNETTNDKEVISLTFRVDKNAPASGSPVSTSNPAAGADVPGSSSGATSPVGGEVSSGSRTATLSPDLTQYRPGETIQLRFSGIAKPAAQDWIGLYALGANNEQYGEWYYLKGVAGGTLQFKAPGTPGSYEFRLFLNWPAGGYQDAARSPAIQVGGAATATTGGSLRISEFTWVDMKEDRVGDWGNGKPNGTPDGHFRLGLDIAVGVEIASIAIYSANEKGEKVGGQVWHSQSGSYWMLGVFRAGRQLNASHVASLGGFSGAVAVDLYANSSGWFNPGQHFLLEVVTADGRKTTSLTRLTGGATPQPPPSAGAASLSLAQSRFRPGDPITVRFTAPAGWPRDAWVGILPSRIPHGSEAENDRHDIAYQYLDQRSSGTLTFTAPAVGDWDLRLHDTDSGGKEHASVSFQVVAATAPAADRDSTVGAPGGRAYTGETISAAGGVAGGVAGGPETVFQGHRYRAILVPGGISWADAKQAAIALGGHLATIASAAENDAVWGLVRNDDRFWFIDASGNGIGPWLGGYQAKNAPEPSGGWRWVSGEAFGYANWAPGEPNNAGGVEDRLHLFGSGRLKGPAWNDLAAGNGAVRGYIVEFGEAAASADPLQDKVDKTMQKVDDTLKTLDKILDIFK